MTLSLPTADPSIVSLYLSVTYLAQLGFRYTLQGLQGLQREMQVIAQPSRIAVR